MEAFNPAAQMSLLDWFAGQALVGYLAVHSRPDTMMPSCREFARASYDYAEEMMAERKKRLEEKHADQ